jgi:hypothetical protein
MLARCQSAVEAFSQSVYATEEVTGSGASGFRRPGGRVLAAHREVNALPAFRRLIDDAPAEAARSSFPGADYIVAVAQAGISWAKTVAERLDLPLAYVRGGAREVGGPLVECAPVRALTSYPQVLASAQEAGLGQRGRRGRAAALLR